MNKDTARPSAKNIHRSLPARVARLFLPLTVFILLAAFYLHHTETESHLQTTMARERLQISLQTQLVHQTFDSIMADLIVLSKNNDFRFLSSASPGSILTQRLSTAFEQFHTFKPHYDQIRFMNATGQEIIRTNRTPNGIEIVKQAGLQSKADRPYFKKAMHLGQREVYISALELNMEHGAIQRPIEPTIRFSMPLFDSHGVKFGVLALNYHANVLLQRLQRLQLNSQQHGSNLILLNQEGYWLKDEIPAREWGFMYPNRKNMVFRHAYPHIWSLINNTFSGQELQTGELFTFTRVHPLDSIKHRLANNLPANLLYKTKPENYSWIIVSHIPENKLSPIIRAHTGAYITATVFLVFIWGVISFILARSQQTKEQTQRLLTEKDTLIRNIVDSALNGIITINEHGIIQSFNPAACNMFGYEEHEAIGQNVSMIIPHPDADRHDTYIRQFTTTRKAHIIGTAREVMAQHKNSSTFPIELFITARQIDDHWLFVGILHDISERKALEAKLTTLAITDGLTGLYNRAYFNEKLCAEFTRAKRYQHCRLSLLIMDADYFKCVNDDFGHPAGDAMLIALAKKAQECARDIDIVARYGGEEFAILLPETDGASALIVADRLRQAIESMQIEYEGHTINRTVSIGIACLQDTELTDDDDLLVQADKALYKAKEGGRNRVVLFEP